MPTKPLEFASAEGLLETVERYFLLKLPPDDIEFVVRAMREYARLSILERADPKDLKYLPKK
jgi:hypothetical protein